MKILCLCSRGNSRSVALGWILKDRIDPAQDAIAAGLDVMSDETKHMLCKWAERIIVVDETLKDKVPEEYHEKMKVWDVGGDRFFRGFEEELLNIYIKHIQEEGL